MLNLFQHLNVGVSVTLKIKILNKFRMTHIGIEMAINLSEYESGKKYQGDYDSDLKELQHRMAELDRKSVV